MDQGFKEKQKGFWDNDNYKHIYEAMKKSRDEISEALTN